ncbi:hypothetical protein FA15DRAFT_611971 [Coprinopsis marcescibilis]|uniref:Uncharacterized protein n=1 Tax=Coprinopsis marcescibilis TaxID=230819 RepID=A0A5C3L6Z6_COPMA|nr:hypothetical protein FA15DRAFT_611971 [Coprinopsis marcescibilis]
MSQPFTPPVKDGCFAFARVKGEVHLVQVSDATPASAFMPVDVNIFKHEFITIFRFAQATTLHPSDFNVLEWLEDASIRYEEENETVFLARDLMDRLRKLTMPDPRMKMHMMAIQNRRYPRQRLRQP